MDFIEEKKKEYDKKHADYVQASINYAMVQEEYKALSYEDENQFTLDFLESALKEYRDKFRELIEEAETIDLIWAKASLIDKNDLLSSPLLKENTNLKVGDDEEV